MIDTVPKAELHVHLDGTLTPAIINELAEKNTISVTQDIFSPDGKKLYWADFSGFHRVFEESFKVVRRKQDYQYITYLYLKSLAKQNTRYAELIVAPALTDLFGISYGDMLEGLVAGIDQAKNEFGIEARILMAFMRHFGPKKAEETARQILHERHPYVSGVNLVGDIKQYQVKAFTDVFDLMRSNGFGASCHAGEIDGGPKEIWQAIDYLGVSRISHGVTCIEDKKLMDTLIERGIVLEICPTSNIILKMYPDYATHPLKQIHDAGIKVTLNTDDPGFFNTDLTKEYKIGFDYGGFSEADLLKSTRIAIEAGFMGEDLKRRLLEQIKKPSLPWV